MAVQNNVAVFGVIQNAPQARCANSLEIDRAHIILEENGAEDIFRTPSL
jgi:hypothetical protein